MRINSGVVVIIAIAVVIVAIAICDSIGIAVAFIVITITIGNVYIANPGVVDIDDGLLANFCFGLNQIERNS